MRLVKLEINGFKSFAKKTEIAFEPGITAIIGPNGSGKSNIADAVRWVLGEQSARALRGSRMEDVIFNGTEQRKPQGYCEVSLLFDNSDGYLRSDYTEVSVMRRVYRSGESEYFINRSACRLKDISELFRDTGIGKEGYSIIGQGKVEEILSDKSGSRRHAFEEAAGVMRYRVRKEEAERKLENTRKNLLRLDDIISELEMQVGPLEEQSASAREYLKLRDELKEIEVNVFLYQYDRLTERLKNLAVTMQQLSEEVASKAALESALAKDCATEEERERALNAEINDVQNKLLTLSSTVEAKSGQARVYDEKMANLLKERERLQSQATENATRLEELRKEAAVLNANIQESKTRYDACKMAFEDTSVRFSALTSEIEKTDALLEKQKNELMQAMNSLSDAKSSISRLEAIKGTLLERMQGLDDAEDELLGKQERHERDFLEAEEQYLLLKSDHQRREQARETAITDINEIKDKLFEARDSMRLLEQQGESGRSRLRVLEEMKRAHEGYYSSVKNVMRDAERNVELGRSIEGLVAELIRVPKEYETAIEMALGSALQNIVTPNEADAKRVIEYLRQKQYGRATLLPITSMKPRLLDGREKEYCNVDGYIGIASDLVGYDARYKGIFENLLGRTVIVRDLDAGIAVNKRARSSFRIATLKGDIINPGGSMTGGSVQKREFSLIGREREIEELERAMQALEGDIITKQSECSELENDLENANLAYESINSELHEGDVELAKQFEKLDIIKKYYEQSKADIERAALERSQLSDNIENIDEQMAEVESERTGIEEGNYATQEDIRATQEALAKVRAEHASVSEAATEERVALVALEKEQAAKESEAQRLNKECYALETSIATDKRGADEAFKLFGEMQNELNTMDSSIDSERKAVNETTDRLRAMEEERAKQLLSLDEKRENRAKAGDELNELRERRHRTELSESKAQMELNAMQDRIWADYELTYENALPMRRQIAITASHVRVDEIKKAIKALGDVNVSAIEDYKNVRERYESLKIQCEDLSKAETDLQTLIAELVSTMEKEFSRQFTFIQQNFSVVFQELFGGGRAELVLGDPKDILNCDIEIIAQPPGKKLQLLSLLSGGERALTAIALLFAILKLKPTAFCILDEIESSLDETNVTNFAEYVRNYSDDTQFILITHRKGSMEVCNALYGVAMEEKGVSKIVSARFEESA